ncbi:DUF6301 family protein [Nocardia sp. NPDC059091]|uniref:DUF6301 family protein n=1 Tax=Nocardia sp. NPDC059091 TaxID=3346724 RepID=UPI00369EC0D3
MDRAGAAEIAEAAKRFDWTWTRANVERFVADVGWGEPEDSAAEAVWLESVTGVLVNQPRAHVFGTDGRVDSVVVTVADMVDEVGPMVAAAFHQVLMGVWTRWNAWNPPTERTVLAEFGASRDFSNVVVGVRMGKPHVDNEIHAVLDNLSTHNTPEVTTWLAAHPNVTFHFTPVGSSWINMVESWFSIITRQSIRRGTFTSVKMLVKQIRDYVARWNVDVAPFTWTATADEILAKVALTQTTVRKLVDNNGNR